LWFNGELHNKPKLPSYRRNGLYQVSFVGRDINFSIDGLSCYLPIPKSQKDELVTGRLNIPYAKGITKDNIAELRIVPSNGKLWAEFVYKCPKVIATNLDYSKAIGIDSGVSNLLTVVSRVC